MEAAIQQEARCALPANVATGDDNSGGDMVSPLSHLQQDGLAANWAINTVRSTMFSIDPNWPVPPDLADWVTNDCNH